MAPSKKTGDASVRPGTQRLLTATNQWATRVYTTLWWPTTNTTSEANVRPSVAVGLLAARLSLVYGRMLLLRNLNCAVADGATQEHYPR